jgi:hypothetical protein
MFGTTPRSWAHQYGIQPCALANVREICYDGYIDRGKDVRNNDHLAHRLHSCIVRNPLQDAEVTTMTDREYLFQVEIRDAHGSHTSVVVARDVVDAARQGAEYSGHPITDVLRVERS